MFTAALFATTKMCAQTQNILFDGRIKNGYRDKNVINHDIEGNPAVCSVQGARSHYAK